MRTLDSFKLFHFIEDNNIFGNPQSATVPISMAIHERSDPDGKLWGSFSAIDFIERHLYQVLFISIAHTTKWKNLTEVHRFFFFNLFIWRLFLFRAEMLQKIFIAVSHPRSFSRPANVGIRCLFNSRAYSRSIRLVCAELSVCTIMENGTAARAPQTMNSLVC